MLDVDGRQLKVDYSSQMKRCMSGCGNQTRHIKRVAHTDCSAQCAQSNTNDLRFQIAVIQSSSYENGAVGVMLSISLHL